MLISRYPGRQENDTVINKIDLNAKLYTHNTVKDVALTNISRETNYFYHSVLSIQIIFLEFLVYVISMFAHFGLFSASRFYQKCSYKSVIHILEHDIFGQASIFSNAWEAISESYTLFFIRTFYKNNKARICPKIKNKLRTIEARLQMQV